MDVRRAWLSTLFVAAIVSLAGGGLRAVAAAQAPSARGSYTGPGSCAAASCHGSVRPIAGSRILQTEYTTWILQDKHAKATAVLTNNLSLRMAKILDLPRPDTAPKCLACHSLEVPEAQRARSYTADGVSCEGCHGPASGWLGPHTTRGWTHAQSVDLGMYDTKDVVKRTEKCASCHIGTAEKSVDHEMIAAGHPDLIFDLEAFSAAMPRHWQSAQPADPWQNVRNWSVGQIVQLREGLERLGRRTKGAPAANFANVWPEYGELDCFACHHSLTRPDDSWRQDLGYADRRPGNVPWNRARFAIARHVARVADPSVADKLEPGVEQLAAEVTKLQGDRARIAERTAGLKETLDALARRLSTAPADRNSAIRYARAITDDAERIANAGERSAEQAAMSLETLFGALTQNGKELDAAAVRATLDRLFQQLENPSAYDPRRFAPLLRRAGDVLPRN
jgi:cytochrome c554/c'-like protein